MPPSSEPVHDQQIQPMLETSMTIGKAFACLTLLAGMGACGSKTDAPAPGVSVRKADVAIIVDGSQHVCIVSLASEPQGSTVPCKDVVAFLKDELRVASGSSYELRADHVNDSEAASVRADLQGAGYRNVVE